LVVVPRERFSGAQGSLTSLLRDDDHPFDLVYVDGGSPPTLAAWLADRAREHDFTLVRTEGYLSPNRARNLGLAHVRTPYVVFLDNDVFVTTGWLTKLLECAEQTGADVVSPLVCEGTPYHTVIHCAGGETGVRVETKNGSARRRFIEQIHHQGQTVAEVRPKLSQARTGLAEFHCMLVRTSALERIGRLDEGLKNTKEHCDLCTQIEQSGGTVWLEPDSVVTYDYTGRRFSDWAYYSLRWSDQWELDSLEHLKCKYGLDDDDAYFQARVKNRGWRRRHKIWKPLLTKLLGRRWRKLEDWVVAIDSYFNQRMTDRYARRPEDLTPRVVHESTKLTAVAFSPRAHGSLPQAA
jgi:GT2 family glycosyltransferase